MVTEKPICPFNEDKKNNRMSFSRFKDIRYTRKAPICVVKNRNMHEKVHILETRN